MIMNNATDLFFIQFRALTGLVNASRRSSEIATRWKMEVKAKKVMMKPAALHLDPEGAIKVETCFNKGEATAVAGGIDCALAGNTVVDTTANVVGVLFVDIIRGFDDPIPSCVEKTCNSMVYPIDA